MTLLLSALVVVLAFVAATLVGTPVVKGLIRHIDRSGGRAGRQETDDGPHIDTSKLLGLEEAAVELRGGEWIGLLERAAGFVCILAGSAAGLGIVLAIKALGRYAELRTPNVAKGERFIIGTLASLLWAGACAGLARVGLWGVSLL